MFSYCPNLGDIALTNRKSHPSFRPDRRNPTDHHLLHRNSTVARRVTNVTIVTCNYEKERKKNRREKVETPFFPSKPYLLPWKPVLGSSRILNSSKLTCMLSLPASLKRIRLRTAEKKWRHHFSNYKPMGIFSDFQGQLTLQWVVQSNPNSNSSELSCMTSWPASMKRIR